MVDHEPHQTPDSSKEPQSVNEKILHEIAASLGFVESERLQAIRNQIATLNSRGETEETLLAHVGAYQEVAEKEISLIADGDPYYRAQLGLMLSSTGIYSTTERISHYYSDSIGDALDYAEGMGFEDVVSILRDKIDVDTK